jgi:hypothetical protein
MSFNALVPAKPTVCKRCGCDDVAWIQSKRTGKWYLAQGLFRDEFKEISVNASRFHDCDEYRKSLVTVGN